MYWQLNASGGKEEPADDSGYCPEVTPEVIPE